jgi:hypothetical protein
MSDTTLSGIVPTPSRQAAPSLQGFAEAAIEAEGIYLASLAAIDQLEVRTRNSIYKLTMLGDGRVLVLGGAFFPDWTEAHLAGSTLGGSFLKVGWVGCGFCMEFLHAGQRIVTTRAKEIRKIEPASSTVS